MDHGSRLLGNSAWNVLSFLASIALNLMIVPFVVARLGVAQFGLAGLVAACVAPATILSVSLSQMTARELTQFLAPGQREEGQAVFATSLLLALGAGSFIVSLMVVVGPGLARRLFNFDGIDDSEVSLAFLYAAIAWFLQLLSGVFVAPFVARQNYARIAQTNVAAALVTLGLIFVLVPERPNASTYLGCLAGGLAMNLLVAALVARQNFRGYLAWPGVHARALGALLRVGGWQSAAQAGGLVAGQVDRYVLGHNLQPEYVGHYNIAQRLQEAVYIGVLKIGEVLFPLFGMLQNERVERQADIYFRASWLLNLLAVAALGGLIPHARGILSLWTGAHEGDAGQAVLTALAMAGILGSGGNVFAFYLLGSGRTAYSALIAIVTGIVTVTSSLLLLPRFGWQAAAWSSLAGMGAQLLVTRLLLPQCFPLPDTGRRFLHFVLMPIGLGLFSAWILRLWVWPVKLVGSWSGMFIEYSISVFLIAALVVAISCMGPYGAIFRADLQQIGGRLIRRHPKE